MINWLVGVSIGAVVVSAIVTFIIYRHEQQSQRASPFKLALIVMVGVQGIWGLMSVLVLLIAYGVTLIL
jgi:heme A synthase